MGHETWWRKPHLQHVPGSPAHQMSDACAWWRGRSDTSDREPGRHRRSAFATSCAIRAISELSARGDTRCARTWHGGDPELHPEAITKPPERLKRNRRPPAPAKFSKPDTLRACVQHRHRAAVLGPAGDVIADRNRAFLAVGDRPHPRGIDAARGEEGAHRRSTPRAQRNVVFAGAALVGVAFDGE